MYIVKTSNIDSDCKFDTLDDALDFVKDQLQMGLDCTIKAQPIPCQHDWRWFGDKDGYGTPIGVQCWECHAICIPQGKGDFLAERDCCYEIVS